MHCHWNAINFSEVNTLKLEKTLISTFAIKFGNTFEHIFPWLPKGHCSRIQKYSSLYLFAWKRWAVTWLTLSVGYSLGVHLFNQLTFTQALSNTEKTLLMNILLVLLHTKHTCRAAWEARKDTTDCYCDIQVTLHRSFYFTHRALHRVKWQELCSCHYSYSYQWRARACL